MIPAETRTKLLALRNKVGADSETGAHISNFLEASENYEKEGSPVAQSHLMRTMARSVKAIETLTASA